MSTTQSLLAPGWLWLASYPKSGNTWLRILLSNLMTQQDGPIDINDVALGNEALTRASFEDGAVVDSTLLTIRELERFRPVQQDFLASTLTTACISRTHDQGVRTDGVCVLGSGRAIHLLRDPRDVAVSLANYLSVSLDDAIAMLALKTLIFSTRNELSWLQGDWSSHVLSWTEQDRIPALTLRYEDMLTDTLGNLAKIADFLAIPCDRAALERAVAHSSFKELRRQEDEHGFCGTPIKQDRFFRSGRAGAWREVLTAKQVRAIESAHGAVMQRWGYELSETEPDK